jgi:hypothetical protein
VKPPADAIESLLEGTHADPFSLLGVHHGPKGAYARAILPGAETAEANDLAGRKRADPRALIEGKINRPYRATPLRSIRTIAKESVRMAGGRLHTQYRLPLRHDGAWREMLNSDAEIYGGSGKGNLGIVQADGGGANVTLPPLATIMLEYAG